MSQSVIDEAFEKAGGRKALREALSVGRDKPLSKQTLSDWKRAGYVPAHHAVAVEKLTGIPREKLCPDFPWDGKAGN
jgi:hypothetical protein